MWPVTCDTVTITVTSDVHQPQPATNHTSSIASTVLRRAFCSSQSSEGTKLYNFCASYFCYLQLFSPVGSMLMKYWHMVVISEASDVWNIICHHVQSITSLELKSLVNNPEQHLTCWPCRLNTAATSRAPAPRERLQTRAGVDQWMTRRAARHLASVSQSALHWSCGRQHQLLTPWPMLDHVIMENVIKNQPDWTKPSFYLQKRIQWCFLCSVQSEHLFTILSLMFGCTRVSSEQCVSLVSWLLGSPGDSVQCSGETWQ